MSHGEVKLHLNLESWEEDSLDRDAQRLGASPNIVHSLDAVHMMMTIDSCPFSVFSVHDSFGTTAGHMGELFQRVRETFVELYETDPLLQIMRQLDCEDLMPPRGNLDLREVLESDYCFC